MILKDLKVFLQNVHKNRILTDIILETQKEFNIIFIQELSWSFIQTIPSLIFKERDKIVGVSNHLL